MEGAMGDVQVLVKLIYNRDKKVFEFTIGEAHIEMPPIQLSRMMEYLDTVWKSYLQHEQNHGSN